MHCKTITPPLSHAQKRSFTNWLLGFQVCVHPGAQECHADLMLFNAVETVHG